MMQESVYCKLVLNDTALKSVRDRVVGIKPPIGNVMLLSVTEKQFNSIEILLGKVDCKGYISDTDRLLVL